jgi:hypothetical protein
MRYPLMGYPGDKDGMLRYPLVRPQCQCQCARSYGRPALSFLIPLSTSETATSFRAESSLLPNQAIFCRCAAEQGEPVEKRVRHPWARPSCQSMGETVMSIHGRDRHEPNLAAAQQSARPSNGPDSRRMGRTAFEWAGQPSNGSDGLRMGSVAAASDCSHSVRRSRLSGARPDGLRMAAVAGRIHAGR